MSHSSRPTPAQYALSGATLLLSLFASTTLGAGWYLSTRTDVTTDLLPWLGPSTIQRVWNDPDLLRLGFQFSLPLLLILLCHELGHFLMCRHYCLRATPPYFLPAPVGLGTFGAFIRIRERIRDKRQLLDIGVAGPIAGFVVLLPFLFYGIARSRPAEILAVPPNTPTELVLLLPGSCLATSFVTWLFHGPLAEGAILDLHPFALSAWVGLLVTSLNLLPLGQLDGGHILYAAAGRLQLKLAVPLWALLAGVGIFFWRGWLFWCALTLLMRLRHPPVYYEELELDPGRIRLAWLAAAILIVSFIPAPLSMIGVR